MTPDLQFRRRPLSFPAMCAYRGARLTIPAALATVTAAKAVTDLGLEEVVDFAVSGAWDVWLEFTVYASLVGSAVLLATVLVVHARRAWKATEEPVMVVVEEAA